MDLGFADTWKKELKSMNKCKVGRLFDFPDSYIEFLAFIKVGFDAPISDGGRSCRSSFRIHLVYTRDICFTQFGRRILFDY